MSKDKNTTIDFSKNSYYDEKVLKGLKLHIRALTYRDIFKHIERFRMKNIDRILEVGSGSGYFVKFSEKKFPKARISALELDTRLHSTIKRNAPSVEISSQNAEYFNFPYKFDLVVSTHVIEHLFNPKSMLACIYDHMTPGGLFIITTPNLNSVGHKIHKSSWNGIRDDHVSLMSLYDLKQAMEGAGFKVVYAGSTFFSGVKLFRIFPFRLINDFLLFTFGSLKWSSGEALIVVAHKPV